MSWAVRLAGNPSRVADKLCHECDFCNNLADRKDCNKICEECKDYTTKGVCTCFYCYNWEDERSLGGRIRWKEMFQK